MTHTLLSAITLTSLSVILTACLAPSSSNEVDNHTRASSPISLKMGDGHIKGTDIAAYDLEWVQCSLQDGVWTKGAPFRESATYTASNNILTIKQATKVGPGLTSNATIQLNGSSLAPKETVRIITQDNGDIFAKIDTQFTTTGFTMTTQKGEEEKIETGKITSNMFDAMLLGLPLSIMDFSKGDYTFDAFMMSFQGTYKVTARLAGLDKISLNGKTVSSQMIDVEWLHNESGDIYPPGPNGSGGRYWVIKNPKSGQPHVARYKTDTYAIEITPVTCPPKV